MQKYILYIGLNDVDGFTILEANGYYVHDDKSITIEKSLKIEFLFIDIEIIKSIVKDIKKALNQESVILQTENITSELI